jgi:hypothetical protein
LLLRTQVALPRQIIQLGREKRFYDVTPLERNGIDVALEALVQLGELGFQLEAEILEEKEVDACEPLSRRLSGGS